MKKRQISKPQIVDWYLDFSNESYTKLKSVISSFKIFKTMGNWKENFWGQKIQVVLFWNLSFPDSPETRLADAKNSEK